MADSLLLVEDNRDDEALILRALRKGGLDARVIVAHDGLEALDYLLDSNPGAGPGLPTFVLLDLNLPKLSGLEVLRRIRGDQRTRRIPVVILTSSREERDIWSCYELGASSYVRKPIGSERFGDVIRQIGTYWLRVNEMPPPAGPG